MASPLLAVFDTETTGVDVENDRIVSAYLGILDGDGALIEGTYWLIDPGIPIPEGATRIHGITTDMVRMDGTAPGPAIHAIATRIQEYLKAGLPLCIYNAPYDLTILDREIRRHEVGIVGDIDGVGGIWFDPRPILDPLVIDKAIDKYRKGSRRLDQAAIVYGATLDDAHNSQADAIAAGRIMLKMLNHPHLQGREFEHIHNRSIDHSREQREGLADYFRSRGKDTEADGVRLGWPMFEWEG